MARPIDLPNCSTGQGEQNMSVQRPSSPNICEVLDESAKLEHPIPLSKTATLNPPKKNPNATEVEKASPQQVVEAPQVNYPLCPTTSLAVGNVACVLFMFAGGLLPCRQVSSVQESPEVLPSLRTPYLNATRALQTDDDRTVTSLAIASGNEEHEQHKERASAEGDNETATQRDGHDGTTRMSQASHVTATQLVEVQVDAGQEHAATAEACDSIPPVGKRATLSISAGNAPPPSNGGEHAIEMAVEVLPFPCEESASMLHDQSRHETVTSKTGKSSPDYATTTSKHDHVPLAAEAQPEQGAALSGRELPAETEAETEVVQIDLITALQHR